MCHAAQVQSDTLQDDTESAGHLGKLCLHPEKDWTQVLGSRKDQGFFNFLWHSLSTLLSLQCIRIYLEFNLDHN